MLATDTLTDPRLLLQNFANIHVFDRHKTNVMSRWKINNAVTQILARALQNAIRYREAIYHDQPCPIVDLPMHVDRLHRNDAITLSNSRRLFRRSCLHGMCPVQWAEDRNVKRWEGFDRTNIVEFRNKLYFCSTPAARESFLQDPIKYLYNQLAPKHHARAVAPGSLLNLQYSTQPALEGFCPVALAHSGALVQGSVSCLVEFQGKIYACADEKGKSMFMSAPAR